MDLVINGILAASITIFTASRNWQRSIKVALVVAVLEGALRKWFLPQLSELIYFFKDFLLIGAYIGYFSQPQAKRVSIPQNKTIEGLIKLVILICILQTLNPNLGSPIIGLFGLRNYLVYLPLIWVVPALFQTQKELYTFLRFYLLLLIPIGCLAIVQFFSPQNSPLNVYVDDGLTTTGGVVALGSGVRVTGTFSYLAGYSVYLAFCLSLLLPMVTYKQTGLWYWATLIEFGVLVITSFMTGARGLMITAIFMLVMYLVIQGKLSQIFNSIQKLIIPSILAFTIALWKFEAGINAFWERASRSQDIPERLASYFTEIPQNLKYIGLDSFGTGATFQANLVIRQLFNLSPGQTINVYYEGETGRIILELGLVGFLVWYGLKLVLLFALWNVYRQLKEPFLKNLALSIFLYQAISIPGQIVFNHTANIFHWFLNSFIFLLPILDSKVQKTIKLNGYKSSHFFSSSYK